MHQSISQSNDGNVELTMESAAEWRSMQLIGTPLCFDGMWWNFCTRFQKLRLVKTIISVMKKFQFLLNNWYLIMDHVWQQVYKDFLLEIDVSDVLGYLAWCDDFNEWIIN